MKRIETSMSRLQSRKAEIFVTVYEVMDRFGVSRATLWRWRRDHDFPKARRIRGKRYFLLSEVNAWSEQQSGQPVERGEQVYGMDVVSDVIVNYGDFVNAMKTRRSALNLSAVEAEAKSGLPDGCIPKLENPDKKYGRGMGPTLMPLWLGGLRVGIVLVDLPRRPRNLGKTS